MSVLAAALAAVLCGLGGLLVPGLIARLPEPDPEPQTGAEEAGGIAQPEELKEPYTAIAASPGLRARSALASAAAGALVGASTGWAWSLLFLLPLVPVAVTLAVLPIPRRWLRLLITLIMALIVIVLALAVLLPMLNLMDSITSGKK